MPDSERRSIPRPSAAYDAQAASVIARLEHVGPVDVIENETLSIPGSINTYQLRAQDPHGPFGGPMLSLISGRYPSGADQVAVTSGVASAFHLRVGDTWRVGGVERQVVGIVENPQSLLDEFALVAPGQVTNPTGVTVLFDDPGAPLSSFKGAQIETPASVAQSNPLNPETISLVALVLGMLLIALVSIGGFTVLAQRRMRSIGMLESTGATDRHVRLVVSANGAVVGVVGAILGFILGLARLAHLPSKPRAELTPPHRRARAPVDRGDRRYGARRRGRRLRRLPAGTGNDQGADRPGALRPTSPSSSDPPVGTPWHRSSRPRLPIARLLRCGEFGSGQYQQGNGSSGAPELLFGIVLLIPGLILLAPFFLSLTARLGRRAPIATRIALRDLARYRARSGSALAAISIGVLVAVIVHAGRRGPVWERPRLRRPEPFLERARPPRQYPATGGNGRGAHRTVVLRSPGNPRPRWQLPLNSPPAPSRSPRVSVGSWLPSSRRMRN